MINFLAILTIIGQAIAFILLFFLLRRCLFKKKSPHLERWMNQYGLWLMLLVALVATGGSLYLSEVMMWAPCKLCWFQRIFIYPQVPLLLVALWRKDKAIAPYILTLCTFGVVIAAGHYAEQVSAILFPAVVDPNVPCDASGVSCAKTYILNFGYISIPLMAFTALLMNLLTSIFLLETKEK